LKLVYSTCIEYVCKTYPSSVLSKPQYLFGAKMAGAYVSMPGDKGPFINHVTQNSPKNPESRDTMKLINSLTIKFPMIFSQNFRDPPPPRVSRDF